MKNIQQILDKSNVFAVVGASQDESKYGYKVFKFLLDRGYEVYPINPSADKILGKKVYSSLRVIPKKLDIISVVTPPKVSLKIVEMAHQIDVKTVWLQPGAEDENVISKADELGVDLIYGQCIMLS